MSAAHHVLEAPVDVEPAPRRQRTRTREPVRTAIVTTPAKDGHTHCALVDGDTGDGFTSPAADGHVHQVRELEILTAANHNHGISARRCTERHIGKTGHHVAAGK